MNLIKVLAGLGAGLLFGAGLAISGMTNPHKVLNFLDVTGQWDPSLALVMAAAGPVSALSFWIARRRHRPFLEPGFVLPANRRLEAPLWAGSAQRGETLTESSQTPAFGVSRSMAVTRRR